VTLVIVATSVLASLSPALRAAQTDPARTLHGQL
jgi:ABC-type lipoprotein release transport system permease subunit